MARILYSEKELLESFNNIKDGSNVAISGFNMAITPEYLIVKLYEHYKETGHPKDLFVLADSLPGVPGRAIDYVSERLYKEEDEEFMKGILIPYMGFAPWLQKLCVEDRVETYSFSIGTVAGWFREIAAGRPGIITKTGLGTYLDPRDDKGAMNDKARKASRCYSELVTINGEEFLLYRAPKPDVSMIRGTTADEIGNITMENESMFGTVLNMTQAAKAYPSPGISYAQVKRVARFGSLNAKNVEVPGPILDYAVVSPESYEWQSAAKEYDPRLSGAVIPPVTDEGGIKGEVTYRNVIERRLAMEIVKLINKVGRPIVMSLGVGIPSAMPGILHQEGLSPLTHSTIESGLWGGIPLTDENFGASIGPFAAIPMPDQFIIYEGGINDMAALGFMEIDTDGDVNPSILANRMPGPGGFPAICAGAPRIFFSGGFTAGKSDVRVRKGKLQIREDGKIIKFVSGVYKVLFSGTQAMKNGKEVLYITERAVFKLIHNGIELVEYAPGVDIEKDIIKKMEFEPRVSKNLKEMDARIFSRRSMGLKKEVSVKI